MNINRDKILVTGASGFIGSHLTEILVRDGYQVRVFIHYNSSNNWHWLDQSPIINDIEVVRGDIRDYDSVYEALKGCNTVFHLAALIGIPYSYISPLAYIRTNIEGTYNILQASKELKLNNILITSTSETYGTAQYIPIDEKHPIMGQSPYSATKIGADNLALSFYYSYKMPIKIVRPFNAYGPRQSARAIIPTIIIQILSGEDTIKLGNILPTRDFTFVKDTANGFIEIAKSEGLNGQVVNIGMKSEISVGKLVNLIATLMNKKLTVLTDEQRVRPEKSEVERLFCDNKKIMDCTKWRPAYNFEQGLRETIEWFNNNLKYYKAGIYNV